MRTYTCFSRSLFFSILFSAVAAMLPLTASAREQPFDDWLDDFRQEAAEKGIRADTLDEALSGIAPLPRVIELDRRQPESTMTLEKYLRNVVPQSRIDKARALYRENRTLLREVSRRYGVQPEYIVALWGIESNFGERMGNFEIVHALATLAYDGRRSTYFRGELLNALKILDQGHIDVEDMKGSWAGAMGQCQFMPSSFLRYAVDHNGDGRKDIWGTKADVFASIAHYLSSEGWNEGQRLGSADNKKSNFNVVLRWNRSRYFATAVGKLADAIREEN